MRVIYRFISKLVAHMEVKWSNERKENVNLIDVYIFQYIHNPLNIRLHGDLAS